MEITQKAWTAEERKAAASDGSALPDGSYPIKTRHDLESAIKLAASGHGNVAAAKKHIKKRAKALGATNLLPEGWTVTQGYMEMPMPDGEIRYFPYTTDPEEVDELFEEIAAPEVVPAVVQDLASTGGGVFVDAGPSAAVTRDGEVNPQTGETPAQRRKRLRRKKKKLLGTAAGPLAGNPGGNPVSQMTVESDLVVMQANEMKRVVTGVLQTPNSPVTPASMPDYELVYPPETVQQMAWDFLANSRNGQVGVMHTEVQQGKVIPLDGKYGTVVESYIAPCDLNINGRPVVQGSWVISYKIHDDNVWNGILRGEYRGASLSSVDVEFDQ